MKKYVKITLAVVICVMCVIANIPVANATATVDEIIKKMSTEEKIGQMITVDIQNWNGEALTIMEDEISEIISKHAVGGVILFEENLQNEQQIVNLTTALQSSAKKSKNGIPLFISTDQEGGEVVRLKTGTSLSGNMSLGAINNSADAKKAGSIIGAELSALGINVDYAPSLDVNSNPENPIIGLRSFSSNPQIVSNLGVQMIKGIQEKNVIASAKHFPGHGDTSTDSHTSLPTVNKTMEQLKECELIPFENAVKNGVDMIMTAHIQFPQIETNTVKSELTQDEIVLPATLSKTFVTDLLRNKMGYNGVVTTDAMNMEAISSNFGMAQACILAINAGVDELLMPVSLTNADSGVELASLIGNIKSAVVNGVIKEETINSAVKRILTLKEKRGILDYSAPNAENAQAVVGSVEHHEIEDDIATKAITVLKNDNNVLPFKPTENQKVVLVAAYSNETPACEYAMSKLISKNAIPNVEYEVHYYGGGSTPDQIISAISQADYVIALSEVNDILELSPTSTITAVTKQIINYTKENNIKCAIISVGKPYDTANYTDAPALLVAYGCNGMDYSDTDGSQPATYTYGPNIIAGIEVAFGYKNPYGMLPVDVPVVISDGSMYTGQLAFKLGDGLLYAGTSRPTEPVTEQPTTPQQTATEELNNDLSENINNVLTKLKENGKLDLVVYLLGGALLTFIILIAVISTGNKKKK
ncbi:MAG: glycoside hydrolase family 3 N-terminal domain-containing protein [Acutalibacteraceae bacterium]|nr:glycoside hydrolase family 3 N-terminal domain-containing protein [Acutalibacteraceae bacterium]